MCLVVCMCVCVCVLCSCLLVLNYCTWRSNMCMGRFTWAEPLSRGALWGEPLDGLGMMFMHLETESVWILKMRVSVAL